ncbi:hypothetical protein ACH4OX_33250 [Streptomyces roseolus]|uniref:hypothetical protein n=1 Tax=Streptomyces roseolus TaxID=67358 RepID=UPI00379B20F3
METMDFRDRRDVGRLGSPHEVVTTRHAHVSPGSSAFYSDQTEGQVERLMAEWKPPWWRRVLSRIRKNPDRILLIGTFLVEAGQFAADLLGNGLGS